MIDEINQLDCELRQLFRKQVANDIYLQLKQQRMTYTQLKEEIGCSDNSLSQRLKEGKEKGVWMTVNGKYTLTEKGKNLPEAVIVHGKAQRDNKTDWNGDTYRHMNVVGGLSKAGSNDDRVIITVEDCDDTDD